MKTAYLGLGSNLGDRRVHLREAIRLLGSGPRVRLMAISGVFETDPVGPVEQPRFLNLVLAARTDFPPEDLLAHCAAVEHTLGRVRREKWGPRTIDVDVLWLEGITMETDRLTLPHPRILERAFVLVPLAQVAPDLVLAGETARARALALRMAGVREIVSPTRSLAWFEQE